MRVRLIAALLLMIIVIIVVLAAPELGNLNCWALPAATTIAAAIEPSFTVRGFCQLERMSPSQLYQEWREGRGPAYYWVGTHRRISPDAVREYRARREFEAQSPEARDQQARASERARAAVNSRRQSNPPA